MANPLPIIVQKYGGSSVATPDNIKRVASLIKKRGEAGYRLCIVVSAMGKTTDQLLALAKEVSHNPSRRELDMLLTCGERSSMALLAMALEDLGVPSISLTGSQSGIITTNQHSDARIIAVRPFRVQDELNNNKVVIVAGFQGISENREITTLGRGGSDTTAVALAAALNAESCEIYSDVEGVFRADPRIIDDTVLHEQLGYSDMLQLARNGAKVLNAQAVEYAQQYGVVIHARKTGSESPGTRIDSAPSQQHVWSIAQRQKVHSIFAGNIQCLAKSISLFHSIGLTPLRYFPFSHQGRDGYLALFAEENAHGFAELTAQLPPDTCLGPQMGTVTVIYALDSPLEFFLPQLLATLSAANIKAIAFCTDTNGLTIFMDPEQVACSAALIHGSVRNFLHTIK